MTADQNSLPRPASAAATTSASTSASRRFRHTGIVAAVSAAIVLSAGAVLAQVLQQPKTAPAAPPAPAPARPRPPATFDTVTVQRGDIQQTVSASGKLQLFRYGDARARVSGQVKEVLVAIGDTVGAGSTLVEITPTVHPAKIESSRAQMARLQAELADRRAQLDFAELQFKRQSQLKAQNATREDAFESSRMSLSSASARVDSTNAQIGELEATLKLDEDSRQHTQVLAPIGGTVVALNARAGQMVGAAQDGEALMRIADLTKLTVQARVAEVDVTRLRRGMAANFTTPGFPGRRWSGKLRQVIPVPADGTGEHGKETFYNVLFEVDNTAQELMSGMSTQVEFSVGQVRDALLLPASALGRPDADGRYSANVLDANRLPSPRKLTIGARNQQQVQVLTGLAAGDEVLLGPLPALPRQATPAAPADGGAANAAQAGDAAAGKPAGKTAKAGATPAADLRAPARNAS